MADLLYDGLSLSEARDMQLYLREKIRLEPRTEAIQTIAGADISLNRFSEIIYAGIVILRYSDLQPTAYSLVKGKTTFPYVPGFLAFREIPALVEAFGQIPVKPDIIMVDGHGIAHPRRMGIAAHFGTLTQTSALGCAKKILFGKWNEPGNNKGDSSPIRNKDEIIGYALRSKSNVQPIFVSPGHQMSLEDSLAITRHCTGKYRLPEPTRRAHEFVNLFRTGQLPEGYHTIENHTLFQ